MKRVNLVGAYNYEKPLPCEMEDVDICSKMACIKKPRSDIWYSPLKARLVRAGFPVIVNYRSIDRWKLVENQKGKMVLFYRECRMPLPIPVIYVVRMTLRKDIFWRIYPIIFPRWKNSKSSMRTPHILTWILKATTRQDTKYWCLVIFYLL